MEEMSVQALCSAVRRDDPLASALGSVAGCRGRAAFALGLGGLGFGLRGTGVTHQLPQELKLRQEELPHHIPPCKQRQQHTVNVIQHAWLSGLLWNYERDYMPFHLSSQI